MDGWKCRLILREQVLAQICPLIDMGAAFHWLRPGKKAPISESWSTAPVQSADDLKASYVTDANVGIRLGEPSNTAFGYLHVIDLDIRSFEWENEAWAALNGLFEGANTFPSVISGSRGASRHLYFFTKTPFSSKKLAKSEGSSLVFDPNLGREVKKRHWEIELFGTGKQVVLPPSIHPDTKEPYIWERFFEFDLMSLGFVPELSDQVMGSLGVSTSDLDDIDDEDIEAIFDGEPLGLSEAEIDATMKLLPDAREADYDEWLQIGMGLAHEYRGSQIGFKRWLEWCDVEGNAKFDMRKTKSSWKSFGKDKKKKEITFKTLLHITKDAKMQPNLPALVRADEIEDPMLSLLGSSTEIFVPKPRPPANWDSLLDRTEEGLPKAVLPNIKLMVQYDARTFGIIAYNTFKHQLVLIAPPHKAAHKKDTPSKKPLIQLEGSIWEVPDPVNGKDWIDIHDDVLRMALEAPKTQGGYGFKVADRDLHSAVNIVGNENRFHPIEQYLTSLKWDGVPRMSGLFVDYLKCDDTAYHREAAELILLGAVARVFEPGHKFDFVPILEGGQGKRKSTFISVLGRGWSSELSFDGHSKQAMVENILGSWIVEVPELQGMSRIDANSLKAWVSSTHDKVRFPYDRRPQTVPRQCVFLGSTNDDSYLRDHTGGRRFWPIKCNIEGEIDTEKLEREIDQIWAEATARYQEMRKQIKLTYLPLFLSSPEAQAEAKALQESRRVETVEDNVAGTIEKWLNDPIGTDADFDDLDPDAPKTYRNATCVMQIWVEMQGKDPANFGQSDRVKIGGALSRLKGWDRLGSKITTKKYGRQQVYVRHESGSHGVEL